MNDVAPAERIEPEALPDPRRWLGLIVLLTGAFLPAFDFFVVNVALPAMHDELGASPADMELIVAGYGLAFAVLLITGGRLGDLYGRKRMFVAGMAGFTIASALCGLAPTPAVLIAARLFQGLTAAVMSPQVLAIIRVTFPPAERVRAIGYFGTTLGLASISAQLVGGALVQANIAGLGWRPIFLVNVPVGAVALWFAIRTLPETRAAGRPRLDLGGIALISLSLFLLVTPLVEGNGHGWPWWMQASLVASVPALAAFVALEFVLQANGRSPLVNLRLFRDLSFSLGLVLAFTYFSGLSAFFLGLTVTLQQGYGYGPFATGLVFTAFGLGFTGASLRSSHIARVLGPRTISLGAGIQVVGLLALMALIGRAGPSGPAMLVLWPVLVFYGCGQGLALPSLVSAVVGSSRIPPQEAGTASGVFSMVQQVSFGLGVAVIMGFYFALLGAAPRAGAYSHAMVVALSCTAALLALTCLLALLLPRRQPVPGVVVHLE